MNFGEFIYSLPEFVNFKLLGEDHSSGTSKVRTCFGPSTQPVSKLFSCFLGTELDFSPEEGLKGVRGGVSGAQGLRLEARALSMVLGLKAHRASTRHQVRSWVRNTVDGCEIQNRATLKSWLNTIACWYLRVGIVSFRWVSDRWCERISQPSTGAGASLVSPGLPFKVVVPPKREMRPELAKDAARSGVL